MVPDTAQEEVPGPADPWKADFDTPEQEDSSQADFLDEVIDEHMADDASDAESMEDVTEPPSSVPSAMSSADEPPEPTAGSPPKSRAPSFWESIFGPRPQPEPGLGEELGTEGISDTRESVRARDRMSEPRQADDEGFSQPQPDQEREDQPRRRPRQRRRGRGRGKHEQPAESEAPDRTTEDFETDGTDAEDANEVDDDQQESASTGTARSKSAGHRNIPTWGDAIGAIVDANLQSRTDRRRSASRTGGSRPRPRGRRKKKS